MNVWIRIVIIFGKNNIGGKNMEDIVSKPVDDTYELVETMGIYCFQYNKTEKRAAYFLPRYPYEKTKNHLSKWFPDIEKEVSMKGKGIFPCIWKIERLYNKVSVASPEIALGEDISIISAFMEWCRQCNVKDNEFLQLFVLSNQRIFAEYKYTETKNSSNMTYYSWSDILSKTEIEKK